MSATSLVPPLRGVLIGAIVVLVGMPPTLRIAVYPLTDRFDLPTREVDRAAIVLVGGALLAVVGSATGLAYLRTPGSIVTSVAAVSQFLHTRAGIAWLAEAAIVPIVGALTVSSLPYRESVRGLLWRPRVSRDGWLLAVFCGGLAVLGVVSWQGHSTAIDSEVVAIVVKFGHMTGAALWTGGLVVLAAVVPRALRTAGSASSADVPAEAVDGARTATAAVEMIRRFSVVALAGVGLATATGLVITAWHVPSVAALGSTPYGLGLAAKVALVLVAAGLGGFNRAVLVAHLRRSDVGIERGPLRRAFWELPYVRSHDPAGEDTVDVFVRAVRFELLVLVTVIVLSVFLTATLAPPVDPGDSSVEIETPMGVGDGTLDAWLLQHGSSFTVLVELAAVVVAVAGIAAVGYELVRWRSHETIDGRGRPAIDGDGSTPEGNDEGTTDADEPAVPVGRYRPGGAGDASNAERPAGGSDPTASDD